MPPCNHQGHTAEMGLVSSRQQHLKEGALSDVLEGRQADEA
jgi:hypothetical protein